MTDLLKKRAQLLREMEHDARMTASFTGRKRLSGAVLTAMGRIPRENYVGERDRERAYINRPLPIGHGQTISQPFIVALMTDLIDPQPADVVLEVGTGSGYQAAVLAELVDHVYSVEVVEALAVAAAERLKAEGVENVSVRHADGADGWVEHSPFDAIIVTAAAPEIPPALIMQLKRGGRMILPVGQPGAEQMLTLVTKDAEGVVQSREVLPVAFVPLVEGD
ncbi:MAG: protein-L-isoaspartate(D-aspartate) O-methyltransferase [Alphaproteobacteria bacterium]|nr:protein-L-isoaspartate(D-aspartate) O-methyltransferase [Alphaproteobacteria bacterium]